MGAEGTITAWVDEAMRRQPVPSGLWQQGGWGPQSIIERPGSENIPMMAHSVKMGEEFQAGGIKADTWAAALGYATLQPLYGRETCAGNVYHDWIDLPAEHIRLEAAAHGEDEIFDLFCRRARAIMTLAALCAQDRNRLVGTPHPTPWNEHVSAPGEQMPYPSAYCGLSRAYISPKVNGSRRTNGRFNEIVEMEENSGGQHLAVALGKVKPNRCTGWTGAWLPNLQVVHGRAALFGLTSAEQALLLQVVEAPQTLTRTDYETLASWLDWNGTTRLIAVTVEWIAFEDGERVFFAHDSINNGSTNMCMGVILRPDGYRQWLANSQPLRQKEKGVRLECAFDEQARTLTSRITQGYAGDPSKQHEEYTLQLSRSKILSHGRMAPRRPQLLVGGDPSPAPPPAPPPEPDMVDVVDLMAPPEMADKVLSRSDGPGYTYHYHDRDAQMIAHINHPQGSPWDVWWYDDDAIYHLLTTHSDHWSDPRYYKRHVPGNNIRIWPRYVPAGATWSPVRMEIPDTGYKIVKDCVEGPRLDLLRGAGIFRPPVPASTLGISGGAIDPEDLCYQGEWRWADEQVVETYTLIPAKGRVMWESTNGKGGTPFDVIEDGSAPLVFPCFDLAAEVKRLRQLPPPQPPPKKNGGGCSLVIALLIAGALALACL